MNYLPDGFQMKEADIHTIQKIGIPSLVLMERASLQVVQFMVQEQIDVSRVLVVCGSGNNGGDGFAVARLLKQKGVEVTALFIGNERSMSKECRLQAEIAKKLQVKIVTELEKKEYTVIIDAVFGVGLSREISGDYAKWIKCINAMSGEKVAIDIPSGVCAKTGAVLGCAFRADYTISFQYKKIGMVWFPGAKFCGKIFVADIGIDENYVEKQKEIAYTLDTSALSKWIPTRIQNSHKGSYGKVLMITGSKGMAGAAYLSAKAAYTAGAGLVRIYTEESNRTVLQGLLPEAIMTTYTKYHPEELEKLLQWADIVCIGCGLGLTTISRQVLNQTLRQSANPCIVDADGITLLSENRELLLQREFPTILTPHMKEMSRLVHGEVSNIEKNRMEIIREFTEKYPVVCVLKDTRTLVKTTGMRTFVNTMGNQAMAKAGAGDVLAGLIAGLLAQHMTAYESAVTGVLLHASAGDAAKNELGSYSVLAEDLIYFAGKCLKNAEEEKHETI